MPTETTLSVPLNLITAERMLIERALELEGSIVDAAIRLGITRHALKRRIIKHGIRWIRETQATPFAAQDGGRSA